MTATAWHAAGVRHELLLRALPALRHDLAGPLSVARMGTTIVRRHLGADAPDLATARERLAQTDEQLAALAAALRGLGHWDDAAGEPAPATAGVRAALQLARPQLEWHGLRLHAPDDLAAPPAWAPVRTGRALYITLAALACLHDADLGAGTVAVDVAAAGDALRFSHAASAEPTAAPAAAPARARRITRADVQALADDLRWPIAFEHDSRIALLAPAA